MSIDRGQYALAMFETQKREPQMIRKTLSVAIATLVLMASVPNVAEAAWVSPSLNPQTFGPVQVYLNDDATDGCWTNLGEVKTYAEDKLRGLGYMVFSESIRRFEISVNSQRMSNGQCYGNISIQMFRVEHVNGLSGFLLVVDGGSIFLRNENANNYVLDTIK